VRCTSQPPPPLYGSFSCAVSTAVGGVCAGNCSSGYIGSPAPSAVCTATGAWSVQGQCINGGWLIQWMYNAAAWLRVFPGFVEKTACGVALRQGNPAVYKPTSITGIHRCHTLTAVIKLSFWCRATRLTHVKPVELEIVSPCLLLAAAACSCSSDSVQPWV